MKRFLLFMVIILSLFIGGRGIEIKVAHAEDYGIIQKQTRLYSGPSSNSLDIGEIEQGGESGYRKHFIRVRYYSI